MRVAEIPPHVLLGARNGGLQRLVCGAERPPGDCPNRRIELPQPDETAAVEDAVVREIGDGADRHRLPGTRDRAPAVGRIEQGVRSRRRRQMASRLARSAYSGLRGTLKPASASRSSANSNRSPVPRLARPSSATAAFAALTPRPENNWNSATVAGPIQRKNRRASSTLTSSGDSRGPESGLGVHRTQRYRCWSSRPLTGTRRISPCACSRPSASGRVDDRPFFAPSAPSDFTAPPAASRSSSGVSGDRASASTTTAHSRSTSLSVTRSLRATATSPSSRWPPGGPARTPTRGRRRCSRGHSGARGLADSRPPRPRRPATSRPARTR